MGHEFNDPTSFSVDLCLTIFNKYREKSLFLIISQRFNFTTSLNRRKPIKDNTQIKIVHKFERLIVLLPKQLYISYNC